MFNLVDLDKNGYISFLEFFTMLVIFKSGNAEDKCRYLFKMYDTDGDGMISYTQLKKMIQSLVEAASAGSSEEENAHLVSEILRSMNYGPTVLNSIKYTDLIADFN
jgi:Ca2+-binding EF-hand superfamily protein